MQNGFLKVALQQTVMCVCFYFCPHLSATTTKHTCSGHLVYALLLIDMQSVAYLSLQHAKPKKPHVESTPFGHQTLILSHRPASHDMFLSIRELVFHVQGQGWESSGKLTTQREHVLSAGIRRTPGCLHH